MLQDLVVEKVVIAKMRMMKNGTRTMKNIMMMKNITTRTRNGMGTSMNTNMKMSMSMRKNMAMRKITITMMKIGEDWIDSWSRKISGPEILT